MSHAALRLVPRSAVQGDAEVIGFEVGNAGAFRFQNSTAPLNNVPPGSAPAAAPGQLALQFGNGIYQIAAGASVQVAPANPSRQFLMIQNQDPANSVQVGFGNAPNPAAAFNQGIVIGPGANLFLDIKVPTNQVFVAAVSGAAASVQIGVVLG